MVRTHERSPSPTGSADSLLKRLKTTHTPSDSDARDAIAQFADGVLSDPGNIQKLHTTYTANEPFKYCVLDKLFQDSLLRNVKDECLKELSFTEKETDIYKVRQTGDLASLSYLSPTLLSLLPSLLTLRDALYSPTFRSFLRSVTNCGPLSGTKQDMSVNSYTKGCHLLNHDDVIGTRRVSYILYLPVPHTSQWKEEWGGALELYPTKLDRSGIPEPEAVPCKKIYPSWNQFVFFEVQPGKSFHSVEEVVVGGEDDKEGRARLSISGWFHAAQEDEEGYEPEVTPSEVRSSREQLTSTTSTIFKSYPDTQNLPMPDTPLTEDHISFLSEFLNPVYLQPQTMKALAARFVEESSLELHSFLCASLSNKLKNGLHQVDRADGLGEGRNGQIPPHSAGTSSGAWTIKSPPHKWRYCILKPHVYGPSEEFTSQVSQAPSDEIIRSLQDELFTSNAFRAWLSVVSRLLPLRYTVEGRRFRPGLDYTLATSEEKEARLDVVLGLTPDVGNNGMCEADGSDEDDPTGWQAGEWGGWECYMAPHDEEDDPAVYRSGSHKKDSKGGNGSMQSPNGKHNGKPSESDSEPHIEDEEIEDAEDEVDNEDGTLLTVQPGFNRLLLVLRDEGVMRFVKYVSAAAESSRWDVCGEYEVGMVQDDGDE